MVIIMAESITNFQYSLLGGLALGWLALGMHMLPGANLLLYATPIAAAVLGQFLLSVWRQSAGAERLEPLLGYCALVAVAWLVFGLLFSPSSFAGQISNLMAVSLLRPVFIGWLRDRQILKGGEDEPERPIRAVANPFIGE